MTPEQAFKAEHQVKVEHGPGLQEYQRNSDNLAAGYDVIDADENFATDYQNLQDKLRQMIYDSNPITMDEKGELVHIMNNSNMRTGATEVLQEVQAPRAVKNIDCLKLLSDILRFILTLFVHEKSADFDFMTAMLDSA